MTTEYVIHADHCANAHFILGRSQFIFSLEGASMVALSFEPMEALVGIIVNASMVALSFEPMEALVGIIVNC
jgi:hypothetical protein